MEALCATVDDALPKLLGDSDKPTVSAAGSLLAGYTRLRTWSGQSISGLDDLVKKWTQKVEDMAHVGQAMADCNRIAASLEKGGDLGASAEAALASLAVIRSSRGET